MHYTLLALLMGCEPTPAVDTQQELDTTDADTQGVLDDVDTDTDSAPDLSTCAYDWGGDWMVWCGGESPTMLMFHTVGEADPECPDYFSVDGESGGTAQAAMSAAACDNSCVYGPHQAVMLLYCDTRGEYITFLPGGPGQHGDGSECPGLIQGMTIAGSGWYETFEQYSEAHPCPETGGTRQ